jgi:predicted dehydrogenase
MDRLRIGVIGTSWWADAMYLPALERHAAADVVAVCGRDRGRLDAFADRWGVPHRFGDPLELIGSGEVDAVVISTPNDTHHPLSMAAIEHGLHVLCEKPLALRYADARQMADAAVAAGVTTLVPFTYRFMPTVRHIAQLIDAGYLGRPHHFNLRYYASYGLSPEYAWRWNLDQAGSGVLGDIGSHFLHIGELFFGEIESVLCDRARMVDRPAPDGRDYPQADDTTVIVVSFASGARGIVDVTAAAHEPTSFGMLMEMDLHGSNGTIHHRIDWDHHQAIWGTSGGAVGYEDLVVPDEVWAGAPTGTVKDTYHHVFRDQGLMIGEWVTAALAGRPARPDFDDGARLQRVLDAAMRSSLEDRRVGVAEIN